ncbi:hypothetical protein H4219_001329 [Mycoemilia scoparia]|uniref:RING-type domain-containing protein n=1 Tax=Mycoemilia scoparia TaxID=417184 RepID=A0A9W8A0D0_9FUNG|nr:hypothetical protein H4219_001329 [Mycoemilia scoparia]
MYVPTKGQIAQPTLIAPEPYVPTKKDLDSSSFGNGDVKVFVLLAVVASLFVAAVTIRIAGMRRQRAHGLTIPQSANNRQNVMSRLELDRLPVYQVMPHPLKRGRYYLANITTIKIPRSENDSYSDSQSIEKPGTSHINLYTPPFSGIQSLTPPTIGTPLSKSMSLPRRAPSLSAADYIYTAAKPKKLRRSTTRPLSYTPNRNSRIWSSFREVNRLISPTPAVIKDSKGIPISQKSSSLGTMINVVATEIRSTTDDITAITDDVRISRSHTLNSEGESIGPCPICLEDYSAGEYIRKLPCGHDYHILCIDTWLISKSPTCPYCKYDARNLYPQTSPSDQGKSTTAVTVDNTPPITPSPENTTSILSPQDTHSSETNQESSTSVSTGGSQTLASTGRQRASRDVRIRASDWYERTHNWMSRTLDRLGQQQTFRV